MEETSKRDLFTPILSSEGLMGPFLLTARLFTTGIFVFYSVKEIVNIHMPSGLLYFAVALQLMGIVLIAVGYKARVAALVLSVCVIATLLFRASAGLAGGFLFTMLKDLAVAGGFLFMFAHGPGPLSLDRRRNHGNTRRTSNNRATGLMLLVGRLLSASVFFLAGTLKIVHTPRTQEYMVSHNPLVPINLVYLAIVTQLVGSALVLLGYKTRYGALTLSGFCIIATTLFHAEFGNPLEVEQFLLDFAIAGGLLFMFAHGPGLFSLDAQRSRAKPGEDNLTIEKGDISLAR